MGLDGLVLFSLKQGCFQIVVIMVGKSINTVSILDLVTLTVLLYSFSNRLSFRIWAESVVTFSTFKAHKDKNN